MGSYDPRWHLTQRGLRPKKSFGQNFLHDDVHLGRIADRICAPPATMSRDSVPIVELGAGTGALTSALLERGRTVHAVERDRDLVPLLQDRFAEALEEGRLVLHEADAKTFDLGQVDAPFVLCGNLPYHLTSKLLEMATGAADRLARAVFLIQLEVAARITAAPGGKTWGALSVGLQSAFDVEMALKVPKGAFWPVPEVDGGVVVLTPLSPDVRAETPQATIQKMARAAFAQRRKTLRKALKTWPEAAAALEQAGVDLGQRAETLEVDQWRRAARELERA